MRLRRSLLKIILFLVVSSSATSQESNYPITNYTTKDYGRDFHPSNMSILQDQRGVIYAANGFKLLEFDGHFWNSYPINKEAWILSLAVDSSGIIYAGSQNEFGYFAPGSSGGLKYISLSDSLDINDRDFKNIWKVHAFSAGVAFQSEEKIFLYSKGKIEIIRPATSFHTSFIVNDILYVRERGTGLLEWKNKGLVHIKGSEVFDTTGVFLMLPFSLNSKKILIGTQEKGLWLLDPERSSNRFRQFKVADNNLIEKAKITGGALTGDGSFAISTMSNGLIIIDTSGVTRSVTDMKNGLSDNEVKQVITDQSNNLWLALNNGISRIEISSPLSVFTDKSGITGSINALIRYKKLLYAGSTTGLFVQQTIPEYGTRFVPQFLQSPVRGLTEAGGWLIAGTDAGLFQISGLTFVRIGNEESYTIYYYPDMKLLFSGGPKGLTVYRYDGIFKKLDCLKEINDDIIGITGENSVNADTAEIWIGTRYKGAIRVKVARNLTFTSERFGTFENLPPGPVTPFTYNSKTIFGTSDGLYEFIGENAVRKSLPDSLKNNKDFLKGYFSALSITGDKLGKSVTALIERGKKVWICSSNRAGYLDKNNKLVYVSQPFNGIDVGKINVIYPEENGICWFGTTDGLIRYDENVIKNYNAAYPSLIRKATLLDNDSALFLGTYSLKASGSFKVVNNQPQNRKPVLQFRNNSLRFEFAAPFYENTDKLLYSCQLEGAGLKWTQWAHGNYQEYANLHEGNYTFRVKARNVYGTESSTAEFSFTLLPPWYRSVIAYIFYVVSAIVLIWVIARLYSYRLKRENIRLETIVTERTAEVVSQKNEIENKNTVLEYQKKEIEDSIRYASRIQSAVIPSENDCLDLLPESFVFFRPLNIVSGDFYWIGRVGNRIIITAADCTGHGVPGAIMSMLGIAFLNEIVNKDHITEPDVILNNLRSKVIQALQQHGISGEARDGMDIALICIDEKENKLRYAGAYNPLLMIRNGVISVLPGDKMPVGFYEKMNLFTSHEIMLERGDVIYLASDGYEDQFGGPEGKKLKSKKFREILLEIHKYPMKVQKEILGKRLEEWMGDLKQIDDIVVIGISTGDYSIRKNAAQ